MIRTSPSWPAASSRPAPRRPTRHPARLRRRPWRLFRALRRRPLARWSMAAAMVLTGILLLPDSLDSLGGSPTQTQLVMVAARDLPAGTVISADDLKREALPASTADRGLVDPVGRIVVADIFRAEPVDPRRVAPDGIGAVAALMPSGTSAVAVPVIGALPPLDVGDLVDVYDTQAALIGFDPTTGPTGSPGIGAAVAVGATVVAVDDQRVTIAVDPDEVSAVATAAGNGAVTLALRRDDPRSLSADPERERSG